MIVTDYIQVGETSRFARTRLGSTNCRAVAKGATTRGEMGIPLINRMD